MKKKYSSLLNFKTEIKKAISPVVATSLLIVVAVISVVAFTVWYTSYQSNLATDVEKQDSLGGLNIDRIEYNATSNTSVFVRNTGISSINVTSIVLRNNGVTVCTNTTSYQLPSQSVTETLVTAEDCSLTLDQKYDVVLITPDGVFSETLVYK